MKRIFALQLLSCPFALLAAWVPGLGLVKNKAVTIAQTVHPAGGLIPITSVSPYSVEVERIGKTSTAAVISDASKKTTGAGADVYPKDLNQTDPVSGTPLFPNDSLYKTLGLGKSAISQASLLNTDGLVYDDWVRDTFVNSDTPSLHDGLATGIIDGVTGVSFDGQVRGHWNGVRLVDGIGNADQDVFVKGAKDDDLNTWVVAPGSVGSASYDLAQIYLADSQSATADTVDYPSGFKSVLYLAAERRSASRSTFIDLEINQLPPINDYVPNRNEGDVLVTVEIPSTSTPTAVVHIYVYKNGSFLSNEIDPNTLPVARRAQATINATQTPSEPWGFVDAKGNWTIGQIPPYCLVKVEIPYGIDFLQGLNPCGGHAFAQFRTRSGSLATSDMKDTMKYFEYQFSGPSANLSLQSECSQTLGYSGLGTTFTKPGLPATYQWSFSVPSNVQLSSADPEFQENSSTPGLYSASFAADGLRSVLVSLPAGQDYADVNVKLSVTETDSGCASETGWHTVRVWKALAASAVLSSSTTPGGIDYSSIVSGGLSPIAYSWKFYDSQNPNVVIATSSAASGTFIPDAPGSYFATLEVQDSSDTSSDSQITAKGICQASTQSNTISTSSLRASVLNGASRLKTSLWTTRRPLLPPPQNTISDSPTSRSFAR